MVLLMVAISTGICKATKIIMRSLGSGPKDGKEVELEIGSSSLPCLGCLAKSY